MMSVAYRSSATATQPNNTNGISVTVTKPTGTVDGDLMVAVTHGYTADTFTPPSGWTFLGFVDDSTGLRSRAYWRIASSEGASYVFSFQPGPGGGAIGASIASFSGSNGIDSWDVVVNSTADPITGSNLVPTQGAMRYDVAVWHDTTANTVVWSIGTERFDTTAGDSGLTIYRGQSGTTHPTINDPGVQLNANSADISAAPTFSIMWSFAIADTPPDDENYASTGFGMDLDLGGTQTDITPYIRANDGINIERGASSEGGTSNPDKLTVTLENTDGRFTALNPTGPYYGSFGLNTPARLWKAHGTVCMQTNGQLGERYRTPTSDTISIAGDLDIRIDAQPKTWRQEQVLAATAISFTFTADWCFYVDTFGYLHFIWNDPSLGFMDAKATYPVPDTRRQTVRVTVDVNNGASGNTVTFYTSDSVTGSFTQLGDAVTQSGVAVLTNTLLFPPLTVGSLEPPTNGEPWFPEFSPFRGKIFEMMLKDGIAGTTVANPSFQTQTTGTYVFTDAQGNIWTPYGDVICSNRNYRFHGELSSLPQTWDVTGTDVTGRAEFSGSMRRIQQNTPPLKSAMYRYYTATDGVVSGVGSGLAGPYFPAAYWPMEDAVGSTEFRSAIPGVPNAKFAGSPTMADYTGFVASEAIPNIKSGSKVNFKTPNTVAEAWAVEFLLSAPSGITNGAVILSLTTSGVDRTFRLSYPSTDNLALISYDSEGAQIATTGSLAVPIAGDLNRIFIVGTFGGADLYYQEQTAATPTLLGSISTSTLGRISSVALNPNGTMNDVYVGHVAVFDGTLSPDAGPYPGGPGTSFYNSLNGWSGEFAADRARRLLGEGGHTAMIVGGERRTLDTDPYLTDPNGQAMGYQPQSEYMSALRQCEETDMGMLYDSRDTLGLVYRTRRSLYNCPAALTLAYDNYELSGVPEGEFDDLRVLNIMTVTRDGGSGSTYEDVTTARSSLAPPNGVGPYEDAAVVSLHKDEDALSQASWRVHLGTVNELRYPNISTALENRRVASDSALIQEILDTDLGDRLVVTAPPSWLPPYQVTQQVIGYTEYLDNFQHQFGFKVVPEIPYQVGRAQAAATSTTQTKTDSLVTTLNEDLDTTETGVDVAIATGGLLWTTSGVDFDIVIGGERMTVTSVSGSSSPQTFTVTRSVNGVVKSHSSGAPVRLWKRSITAL